MVISKIDGRAYSSVTAGLLVSNSEAELVDVGVNRTYDANKKYPSQAKYIGCATVTIATERGDRSIALVNIHSLDNEQIIVERNHGVD